jgi:hypothetical protein
LRDLFNELVIATHSSANSHVPKRASSDKATCSPRIQSRLESVREKLIYIKEEERTEFLKN